jgi:eukaryotic-like serine/threonine-protein kinase
LKILRGAEEPGKAMMRRFEREARIVGRLRHANTIRLYDVGQTDDGDPFLVMELLVGRSLADALHNGPMPPQRALVLAQQIAGTLAEAHDAGIVHRDIKPANIFLDRVGSEDVVKVLDFGIAREMTNAMVTRTDQLMGSPAYMAPEQASGARIDHRTDIYALGVLLFHVLAGRPPFAAETTHEMMAMHLTQLAPRIFDDALEHLVLIELEQLILQMLEKRAEDRPQTMLDVRASLERISRLLDGSTSRSAMPALQGDAITRSRTFLKSSRWARAGLWMFGAAGAIAAVSRVAFLVHR